MVIKFFTFGQYHNRKNIGSTKIRVDNLLKHWPEASLYKYGDKMDVMIFQKVYCTFDYKYPKNLEAIKILDACDIEWYGGPDIYIKETLDCMNAVVVPTEGLRALLQQMTDTPVRVIKDRFDLDELPKPIKHKGELNSLVWFGYSHNAELLKSCINPLVEQGIKLTVISNEDPLAWRWANDSQKAEKLYSFKKYTSETAYKELQKHQACILPKGYRPEDRFKSENKTVLAQLLGLPVITNLEELEQFKTPEARQAEINTKYDILKKEYDVKNSVKEYKELINELKKPKT